MSPRRKLKGIDKAEKFKEPILNAIDKMLDNGEITDEMAKRVLKDKSATGASFVNTIEKKFDSIFKIK